MDKKNTKKTNLHKHGKYTYVPAFKKRGRKTFKRASCAPGVTNQTTCLSKRALTIIKDAYNETNPTSKILDTDEKHIFRELKTKLREKCDNEVCIALTMRDFIRPDIYSAIIKNEFSPIAPKSWLKNKNEWLSGNDILSVMRQYESKYTCFKFLGPSPIDFDAEDSEKQNECVSEYLCKFNLQEYINKGKTKIGFIFNTDTHDKGGSHWVSLFLDFKKKIIFYFDSVGDPSPREVIRLCNRIIDQVKNELGVILKFDQNAPKEHQFSNTECGIYCLYFIIAMLTETHTYKCFKKHKITDKGMEQMRGGFFNIV
jgi:Ulp1 protease family, C-terminal catalytic domain